MEPDTIQTTDFLSFADIEPIDLPAVPIAQHLAEKVHAYTRNYGAAERRSMRPKDLIDILLIEGAVPLDAQEMTTALERTFESRATHPLPERLPPPPHEWAAPYRRLAEQVGIEGDVMAGFSRAAALLEPLLERRALGQWDARRSRWTGDQPPS